MLFLSISLISPIFEEILFREFLLDHYRNKEKKINGGVIFLSLLFSLWHTHTFNLHNIDDYILFINVFLIGVFLSFIRLRYGLILAILAHVFYNLLIFLNEFQIINLFILDYIQNIYMFWISYIFILFLLLKNTLLIKND